jgi:3',5'-cyclic AMP phosphodiesterase CpdA
MSIACRILHLSDLHWDEEKAEDQKIIIGKLKEDLAVIAGERAIDFIVFSGDLVNKGGVATNFAIAKQFFLDVVRDVAGLSDKEILICPGNHDVDRLVASKQNYIEAGLNATLLSTTQLNSHIDKYLELPLEQDDANLRLTNYFRFVRGHYNVGASLSTNYVDCVIKKTTFGDLGFAIFNSTWRSTGAGEIERNHMLLGERVIDKAADQLKGCLLKIAVLHHPLE